MLPENEQTPRNFSPTTTTKQHLEARARWPNRIQPFSSRRAHGHGRLKSDVSEPFFSHPQPPLTLSHSAPWALGPVCLRCHSVLHSAPAAQKNKKRRCQGDGDGALFRGRDVRLVGPRNQPIAFGRVGRAVCGGGGLLGGCEAAIFGVPAVALLSRVQQSQNVHIPSVEGGCVCEREIHFGGEQRELLLSCRRRHDVCQDGFGEMYPESSHHPPFTI